jgi:hypothetical protein
MGNKAEAFDTEKWALAKSLTWAVKITSNNPHKNIKTPKFYIDNVAVVKTAYDITPASGQWIGKHIKRDIDRWILAHKGIKGNEKANILAKAACSKTDTFKKKSTRAHALRMNKEESLKEWKDRWLDTVGKGRFAWANRRPPTWKPPPHLLNPIKQNTFGRLMQARIGHTHIGEYYRDFNILEDISCPCGAVIQARIHILSECLLFNEHRHRRHDKEQNIIPTDLFSTKEGIECLTEFLDKMNAFASHN